MPKTLHNSPDSPASANVSDLRVYGNPGQFRLLFKASSVAEG